MAQIFEQRPIREIRNSFITPKQNLDVSESFSRDHLIDFRYFQTIQKVGIQNMEIELNASTFHNQILGHPRPVFLGYNFTNFIAFLLQIELTQIVKNESSLVLQCFWRSGDFFLFVSCNKKSVNVCCVGYRWLKEKKINSLKLNS